MVEFFIDRQINYLEDLERATARGQLAQDNCPGDGMLCAPSGYLATPPVKPRHCSGKIVIVSFDGVCLPDCLPAFDGLQGLAVPQGNCGDGEKCVPCENPITGNSTGACN